MNKKDGKNEAAMTEMTRMVATMTATETATTTTTVRKGGHS